jgi:hypothetical protein
LVGASLAARNIAPERAINTYTASGLNDTLDGFNNGHAAGGPSHCRG